MGPLEDQYALLTAESSLQPQNKKTFKKGSPVTFPESQEAYSSQYSYILKANSLVPWLEIGETLFEEKWRSKLKS